MLFRSGENLWSGALDFISESNEVTLYSAYIKTAQLKELNKDGKIKRIVVRWEIIDLHQGASDLDLYDYCLENKIALFRNTRIHLKCLQNEQNNVFLGSANISGRGIRSLNNFNYELNAIDDSIDFLDTMYLQKILKGSEYVSERIYHSIKEALNQLEEHKDNEEYERLEMSIEKEKDYFLISELPMYMEVSELYDRLHKTELLDELQKSCIAHDIATYDLNIELPEEQFYQNLKNTFNSHPFVLALKEQIKKDRRKSLSYGRVAGWIAENTTTVPTPISWELKEKQVVNILYKWICFCDEDYRVERPRYSEVIFYRGN